MSRIGETPIAQASFLDLENQVSKDALEVYKLSKDTLKDKSQLGNLLQGVVGTEVRAAKAAVGYELQRQQIAQK